MQNMYDVFSAIRADEGDHVSAMEACLDPNVSLQSPSLERRVVTGMAATALASYFLVTTGFLDASLLDTGTVDAATAASGDLSLLELSVAGVASWARDFIQTQEEGGFAGLAEDAVEGGLLLTALEGLQKKIVEILMRIF